MAPPTIYERSQSTYNALSDTGKLVKDGLGGAVQFAAFLGFGGVKLADKAVRGAAALPGALSGIPLVNSHLTKIDDNNDDAYLEYRSRLAQRMDVDKGNAAELRFVNSMDRLLPSDGDSWHKGHWQDLDGYDETAGYMASILPSAAATAFKIITSPLKLITVPAQMAAEATGLLSKDFSYADSLDPQAKRASYAAIGLMTGQYLALMTPRPDKWFSYEKDKASRDELETLRQTMYGNIKKLMPTIDNTKEKTPFEDYKETVTSKITEKPIPDYNAQKAAGVNKARDAIKTHYKNEITDNPQNGANAQIDNANQQYITRINELNQKIEKNELNDPRVINMHLHQLRLQLKQQTESAGQQLLAHSKSESKALFDAAKLIDKEPNADLSPLNYQGNLSNLKTQADSLLTALKEAGPRTDPKVVLSVESKQESDDAAVITGGTGATQNLSLSDTLDKLKAEEESRLDNLFTKQNQELNNKLSKIAENYHRAVNESINAASHVLRLQGEQLTHALGLESESQAEPGNLGGPEKKSGVNSLPSTTILARVIKHGFQNPDNPNDPNDKIPGIEGPAWQIRFTPSDPPSANGLGGKYSATFTKQSPTAKQQAIIDQASLISFSTTKVRFIARARTSTGHNPRATFEIALMQAIAIQNTSGLDPKTSTIRLSLGFDAKGKEVLSSEMTIEQLHLYDSARDPNPLNHGLGIRAADYYKVPQAGIFSNYKGNQAYLDYQKAVEARSMSDAGKDFTNQENESDPQVSTNKTGKAGLAENILVKDFKRFKSTYVENVTDKSPASSPATASGGFSNS